MTHFNSKDLSSLTYNENFNMWHYRHENHSLSAIKQLDYFRDVSGKNYMFVNGDLIMINAVDGNYMGFITIVDDSIVLN